ncbi:vomeronasal 1 receptor oryCunV1R1661 [Oryctolagus cuniculus]|uniref:vomeronasal 1 receptor oryCunV1R1661 n=1 Tax=Oryctolagus cuniculus TaxID=9986 RepID=UPI0001D134D0|nr:vomeronasal 1 receptor oryCunV1R1661 [Oryctolagus cuniculus]
MFPSDTIYSFFLIAQMSTSVTANSLLFMIYIYTFLMQPQLKKPIDWIFMHLTMANILNIIFHSMPEIMSSFGVKRFLDNIGCQIFLYIYRVTRGLSICTTSLLSVFQAITISPSNSKWARLKFKLSTWIFPSFLFFWVINMLIYIQVIKVMGAKLNFTMVGQGYVNAYCQSKKMNMRYPGPFVSSMVIRDLLFVALMIMSSLYMVGLLYRHHRRAQHIHSSSLSRQTSPENRATHTILLLVFCFVVFYFLHNVLTLFVLYRTEKNTRLESISGFLSTCYPTLCPFFLMKNNKMIPKLLSFLSNMRMTFPRRAFSG